MRKTPSPRKLHRLVDQTGRELYRLLETHYHQAACEQCTFYKQYGVMIVKGDFAEHIRNLGGDWSVTTELDKLVKAKLIEIDKISTHQYRITFVHIQSEKVEAIA